MEPVANSLQNTSWCTAIQVCLPHGNNCKTQNITRWLTAIQVSRPHGNIKPFKHTCMHIAIQISLPSGSNLQLVNRSQAKINRLPSEGKIPQHPIAASCLSEALNNPLKFITLSGISYQNFLNLHVELLSYIGLQVNFENDIKYQTCQVKNTQYHQNLC